MNLSKSKCILWGRRECAFATWKWSHTPPRSPRRLHVFQVIYCDAWRLHWYPGHFLCNFLASKSLYGSMQFQIGIKSVDCYTNYPSPEGLTVPYPPVGSSLTLSSWDLQYEWWLSVQLHLFQVWLNLENHCGLSRFRSTINLSASSCNVRNIATFLHFDSKLLSTIVKNSYSSRVR